MEKQASIPWHHTAACTSTLLHLPPVSPVLPYTHFTSLHLSSLLLVCLINSLQQNVWKVWNAAMRSVQLCDSRWGYPGSRRHVCTLPDKNSLWSFKFCRAFELCPGWDTVGWRQKKQNNNKTNNDKLQALRYLPYSPQCLWRLGAALVPLCVCCRPSCVFGSQHVRDWECVVHLPHSFSLLVGCQCWIRANSQDWNRACG